MSKKNNKDKLAQKVFAKIDKEHIVPTPKWQFSVREYILWAFSFISIFVGALAVSVIILHITQWDMVIAQRASGGVMRHIAILAPYLWIGLIMLTVFLARGSVAYTKRGYRYSYILIVGMSIILSIILGVGFYATNIAERVEVRAAKLTPHYQSAGIHRQQMWSQPARGLLAGVPLGTMTDNLNRNQFELIDFAGNHWTVDGAPLGERDWAILAVAGKVAMVGLQTGAQTFRVCRVIPWNKPKDRRKMRKEIMQFAPTAKNLSERNIFQLRNIECK